MPIASITRKIELRVLSHTTYTAGTMVLPSEVQPNQEPDNIDLDANNRELASLCKNIFEG